VPFQPKTFTDIFNDMRERTRRSQAITDFEVGSVARTLYESFAYEMALLYEKLHQVYLSAYVDTARGEQLELVVSILGLQRNQPDYAAGEVSFERGGGDEAIDIPVGTLVATEDRDTSPQKTYRTIAPATLAAGAPGVEVRVEAVNRGETESTPAETVVVMPRPIAGIKAVVNRTPIRFVGRRQETDEELQERAKNHLIAAGKATLLSIQNAVLVLPGVRDALVQEHFNKATPQYGVVDVTVDSLGFRDASAARTSQARLKAETKERQRLQAAINQVRAAGVMVRVSAAQVVEVDAVVKIDLAPTLTVSAAERFQIETDVGQVIRDYITERKMGQPLLLSQIMKQTLLQDGVDNLADVQITACFPSKPSVTGGLAQNRIDSAPEETFTPRYICVASEPKDLRLDIAFKVAGLAATVKDNWPTQREQLRALLQQDIRERIGDNRSAQSDSVVNTADLQARLQTRLNALQAQVQVEDFVLRVEAQPWCQRDRVHRAGDPPAVTGILISFVERPVLGEIFAYEATLHISGTLMLTLPTTTPEEERQRVQHEMQERLTAYVDHLPPETPLIFADFMAAAVHPYARLTLEPGDFQVTRQEGRQATPAPERLDARGKRIVIAPFEKAILEHVSLVLGA
jgi:uncharacterized phage protein gp47/JayE